MQRPVQSIRHLGPPGAQRPALAPPCRMQMAWAISSQRLRSAVASGSSDLETASLSFILLRYSLSFLAGDLQHYGEEQYLDARRV